MTATERNKKVAEWTRTLAAIEKRYAGPVYRALRQQVDMTIGDLRVGGIEYAKRRLNSLQFSVPMGETIQEMHRNVGLMMARRTYNDLDKEPQQKSGRLRMIHKATLGQAAQWIEDILEYFRLHLLESVESISNTTREWINRQLDIGFQRGYSTEEIVNLINNREYLGHRTEVIVRTESVRAANYGVQKGAETYEYQVVKEWAAVRDDRTRHSHRAINSQQRPLNEQFSNGLMFPGDPEGAAGEVINCRCAQLTVPVRDKDGRLIPKTQTATV